jgi:hypothetical protein
MATGAFNQALLARHLLTTEKFDRTLVASK